MKTNSKPAALLSKFLCASLMIAVSAAVADSRNESFRVHSIQFKENGRLDPELMSLCDARKSLQEAATAAGKKKRKADSTAELDLRIDRIARLGYGQPGVRWGGLEYAVTATFVERPSVQTQFMCRTNVIALDGRSSFCSAIVDCSRQVSKNILTWLAITGKQPVAPQKD